MFEQALLLFLNTATEQNEIPKWDFRFSQQ
jgi:hypothetical protein